MSSNIRVQRVCKRCGVEFTARTTVTMYCGDGCSKKAYKERLKDQKVLLSDKQTQEVKIKPLESLKAKEYLSIQEVCLLLSVSRWTVWRAIKNKEINAGKIGRRRLIKKTELAKLFDSEKDYEPPQQLEISKAVEYEISECYNLTEVQSKYGISEKALHELIKRNNLPKIKKGWFAYVPKVEIDNLLS